MKRTIIPIAVFVALGVLGYHFAGFPSQEGDYGNVIMPGASFAVSADDGRDANYWAAYDERNQQMVKSFVTDFVEDVNDNLFDIVEIDANTPTILQKLIRLSELSIANTDKTLKLLKSHLTEYERHWPFGSDASDLSDLRTFMLIMLADEIEVDGNELSNMTYENRFQLARDMLEHLDAQRRDPNDTWNKYGTWHISIDMRPIDPNNIFEF